MKDDSRLSALFGAVALVLGILTEARLGVAYLREHLATLIQTALAFGGAAFVVYRMAMGDRNIPGDSLERGARSFLWIGTLMAFPVVIAFISYPLGDPAVRMAAAVAVVLTIIGAKVQTEGSVWNRVEGVALCCALAGVVALSASSANQGTRPAALITIYGAIAVAGGGVYGLYFAILLIRFDRSADSLVLVPFVLSFAIAVVAWGAEVLAEMVGQAGLAASALWIARIGVGAALIASFLAFSIRAWRSFHEPEGGSSN